MVILLSRFSFHEIDMKRLHLWQLTGFLNKQIAPQLSSKTRLVHICTHYPTYSVVVQGTDIPV